MPSVKEYLQNLGQQPPQSVEKADSDNKFGLPIRLLPLSVGSGLLAAYLPLMKPLKGTADYWHGAPAEYAGSIGQKGILIDYAGANKRINSILASNSVLEALGNAIEDLPDDHPAKQKLRELLPEHGGKFDRILELRDLVFDAKRNGTFDKPLPAVDQHKLAELLQKELGFSPEHARAVAASYAARHIAVTDLLKTPPKKLSGYAVLDNLIGLSSESGEAALKLHNKKLLHILNSVGLLPTEEDKKKFLQIVEKATKSLSGDDLLKVKVTNHLTEHFEMPRDKAEKMAEEIVRSTKGHYIDDLVRITNTIFKHHTGKELPAKEIQEQLFERGKRIYLSQSAPSAYMWGFHGNESSIMDKLRGAGTGEMGSAGSEVKKGLYKFVNAVTFGIPELVKQEVVEPLLYHLQARKAPIKEVDFTNPHELEKVLREHGINPAEAADRYSAVFKVTLGKEHIPSLGAFKDFKGFEALMGSAPLLRQTLAEYLPNYTPGRDISVGKSIAPHQLKELHIVDLKTGKTVLRLKNKAFRAPERAGLKGIKTVLKHAPFVAVGGYLLYKGLGFDRAFKKEASVSAGTSKKYTKQLIRKALKYGIPAGLLTGAYTAVSHAPKLMYEYHSGFMSDLSPSEQVKAEARLQTTALSDPIGLGLAAGSGIALGAGLLGLIYAMKRNKPEMAALTGGLLGGAIVGTFLPGLSAFNPIQSVVGVTEKDDPKKAVLKKVLIGLGTALPVGYATYAAIRHYPHHVGRAVETVTRHINMAIKEISGSNKTKEYTLKGILGAGFLGGLALGAGTTEYAYYRQLKEIEAMKKEKDQTGTISVKPKTGIYGLFS